MDFLLCLLYDAHKRIENFVLYNVRADEDCSWRERESRDFKNHRVLQRGIAELVQSSY